MSKTKEQQAAEDRERLRLARQRNYRVKRANAWRCWSCGADQGIMVVRTGPGEEDDSFSTRCRNCIGDLEPAPGQLAAMEKEDE